MKHLESFLLYILKSVLFFAFTFVLSLSFLQQKFPPSIGTFLQQMKTARSLYSANQSLLNKVDGNQDPLAELLKGNGQNFQEILKSSGMNSKLEYADLKNKMTVSEQKMKQLEYEIGQLKTEIEYLKNKH